MDLSENPWTSPSNEAAANGGTNKDEEKEGEEKEEEMQNLNGVISSIDKTLALLHQLHLTVSSFSLTSQLPLIQRVNSLVQELDTLQRLGHNCSVQVPMEVVTLIDDGKNPDEFNRNVLDSCITKNQVTKGKTEAFKSLRGHLLEELDQAFPDEVEIYREIRASTAAESKGLAQAQSNLPNGEAKVKMES